jgi:hypothetical protein
MRTFFTLLAAGGLCAATALPAAAMAPKYKNHTEIQNACSAKWEEIADSLTCKAQKSSADHYIFLGGCSSAKKNGIATQNEGKCSMNIQLSCRKRDGRWANTQAACKSVLKAPETLENDDGTIIVH